MDFKDRFLMALRTRQLTQAVVAEALGVSAAAASAWATGEKRPSSTNIEGLASVLGVSASWLQFGAGEGPTADPALERSSYQSSVRWYHRDAPRDLGREMGNAAGFAFEADLHTLARETGQNSLDEPADGEQTVRLVYDVIELVGGDLDRFLDALQFDVVRPHLESAAEGDQKANQVIAAGLRRLDDDDQLLLVRIADYNATGLTGPEYDSGHFMAVCRNTLDSHKASDTAAGSFGLGKATMWSSSEMGLVITNSRLSVPEDGELENRFFARMEIPWHQVSEEGRDKPYAGPAWYGDWDEERQCTRSLFGNGTLAKDLYVEREGDASGATFLIVGAFDPSGQATSIDGIATELTRALATNFWAAMTPRGTGQPPKLQATVRTFRGAIRLSERIIDPADYRPALVDALRRHYDNEVVDRLTQAGDVVRMPVSLRVPEEKGGAHPPVEHEAVLLVSQAEEPSADEPSDDDVNQVSYVRGNNMTIREYTLPGLPLGATPFHAIVLAGTAAGGSDRDRIAERFLRAAEPPAHDRWTGTPEITARYARGARSALERFENTVKEQIRETIKPGVSDASDGPQSLKELIRLVPPKETPKRLGVRNVKAKRKEGGAWEVTATVSIPANTGTWRFSPVLKFGTESGPALPVTWASVRAGTGCDRVGDRVLRTHRRARSAQFTAMTDPASHPVGSQHARVAVDIRDARREGVSHDA